MAGPTGRRYTASRVLAAWIGALAIALTGMSTALAQAALAENQLKDIQVQALSGDRIELRLLTSGAASEPLAFTIDNPARISLDLQNTTLGLDKRRKDVNVGPLSTILAAEAGGKTRVVLNLDKLVPYQTRVDGNAIVVTLGAADATAAAVTSFPETSAAPAAARDRASRSVSGVDFRRGDNGAGRVVISLSDPATPVDVRKEGDRVVLSFNGATLPANLQKRLDVTDFATPVNSIESVSTASGTRISIAAKLPFQELAYQSDNVFSVEIAPVVAVEQDTKPTLFDPDREYIGERLTLSFQDIETRAVLQLLADVSGRNIIVSDSVSGNVTLRLQNVPWDQALDIVLATKGLDMRENGGVIIVAPADEIASREKADLEARKDIRELEPLLSEFLQVNYAKAADLAELMKGKGGKGNALLSERGSVAIDERTNTLLVQDVSENLGQIRRLVSTLDIPVRQVLIESRIVIVNDDFSRDLGMRWGVTAVNDTSDGLIAVTGSSTGTNTIVNSALNNQQSTGSMYPVQLPALGDRYNVNLPVANPAGRLGLALLGEDYLVDLELSAAQAEGRGEVISSPRVITANQKEASIRQGVEIPYQESSSSGATSTQFKEAVLSLKVKPQITPDDRIILDLTVTKDSVGQVVSDERGGSIPSIDTREVVTQVLVNNGQTVVLGGVYETEEGEQVSKVPFLGDIPGVGVLFRSTRKISNKSELLIFVTPKILKEG
ncbi:MAG: type IV pilus secretin PilQ family protein, partial [Gammaproteobacteria bacterium]|nr:type IV pilus secretin PilQ family protein [Gammaproteobacteria bacterium]